ncbi:hypothetical protein LSTR_LSTR004897 [Laodelphax striatellus]|uniref:Uncharacterized protein n=1 Tax=Laodelphax striatellus TaxID=195883 RepID=A0A482XP59_LAOST|nr:hypothetical protein LSTR_LSTR004897 [Laodelphax striatellus]
MKRCGLLVLCWLSVSGAQQQEDSLRGALEAVTRRHQDMQTGPSSSYYIGQPRSSQQMVEEMPYFENQEYGQPEDIGYGYQKSVAPHTAGLFEPIALPSSELGAHEALANNRLPRITEKEMERLTSEYIGDEPDNSRMLAHRLPTGYKRSSVFRERDEPEAWQLADAEAGERLRGPSRARNALALVRNFGGLDRDQQPQQPGPDSSDPDSYLRLLNYVYHKYKAGSNEFDPEDIGDGDVEDLIEYLGRGENRDKKRSDYNNGYEFLNYPSSGWYKRSDQRIDTPQSDGFFHALKFLSGDRDALESMRNEEAPGEDEDEDVSRLLMEQGPRAYRKRYPAIGGFDDRFSYKGVAKRFPVTKRSLQSSSGPKNRAHQTLNNAGTTDPEVAQELDNIFSASGEGDHKKTTDAPQQKDQNLSATTDNPKPEQKKKGSEMFPEKKEKKDEKSAHSVHRRDKEVAGQKEETNPMDNDAKPVEVRKKSIDWSEYFGIDRRRKKSATDNFDDEWLLNQYLQAYSAGPKKAKAEALRAAELEAKNEIPYADDIDGKLRAMEDLIVEEALKYTGANQGLAGGDQAQVRKVKERVMSQLAAAYSLEKMRRALGEFKSSIGSKQSPHNIQLAAVAPNQQSSTPPPTSDAPREEATKRVAVKKEKAEAGNKEKKFEKIYQEDIEKNYLPIEKPLHSVPLSRYYPQKVDSCPILDEIIAHCRQISILSGDMDELFLPLCTLHQTCSICGGHRVTRRSSPDECDVAFMNQMTPVCGENASCIHSARRMMAGMASRRQRGGGVGSLPDAACNNPCLAPFLTIRR